jgi:acetolactate synthase-1/2/3 large subunit
MQEVGDLDTAVRYKLPILIVVNNNSALGAEVHSLRKYGYPDSTAMHKNPSFEAVAGGFGLEAVTVRKVEDLEKHRDRMNKLEDGPFLLDCKVNLDVAPSRQGVFRSVFY